MQLTVKRTIAFLLAVLFVAMAVLLSNPPWSAGDPIQLRLARKYHGDLDDSLVNQRDSVWYAMTAGITWDTVPGQGGGVDSIFVYYIRVNGKAIVGGTLHVDFIWPRDSSKVEIMYVDIQDSSISCDSIYVEGQIVSGDVIKSLGGMYIHGAALIFDSTDQSPNRIQFLNDDYITIEHPWNDTLIIRCDMKNTTGKEARESLMMLRLRSEQLWFQTRTEGDDDGFIFADSSGDTLATITGQASGRIRGYWDMDDSMRVGSGSWVLGMYHGTDSWGNGKLVDTVEQSGITTAASVHITAEDTICGMVAGVAGTDSIFVYRRKDGGDDNYNWFAIK